MHDPFVGPQFFPRTQAELTALYGATSTTAFQNRLMTAPFFNTGFDPVTGEVNPDAPGDIPNLFGTNGSSYASPQQNRNRLLTEMIPARSTAAGSNPIAGISGTDMNSVTMKNGWPNSRPPGSGWWHSDLRNVAYFHTHKVFDEFVSKGKLNQ